VVDTRIVPSSDPTYPSLLREAGESKPLHVRGTLPRAPGVAIVGTRRATVRARAFTAELAAGFARAGVAVWSGGAHGIDTAAHEGALASGGATVVVLGSGFEQPYPKENIALFREVVARGGALVSLVADDVAPRPQFFIERNGVLAGATRATLVVECPLKSGARSATARARAFGRPVGAVPHSPWSTEGAGCLAELALGAKLVASLSAALALAGIDASGTLPLFAPASLARTELSEPERTTLLAILDGASSVDSICEHTQQSAAAVVSAAVSLLVAGLVRETSMGFEATVSRAAIA